MSIDASYQFISDLLKGSREECAAAIEIAREVIPGMDEYCSTSLLREMLESGPEASRAAREMARDIISRNSGKPANQALYKIAGDPTELNVLN